MENASKALIIAGAILIAILLITIGIVLIRSGNDVTTTGTSQMASQNIQAFNIQFTAYEGTHKGSELKNLVNVVKANNASNPDHNVYLVGKEISTARIGELVDTKTYNVEMHYATSNEAYFPHGGASITYVLVGGTSTGKTEKGYIDCIIIEPKS